MPQPYTIILAPNPSIMTGPGTNTIILGGGAQGALVIDPADENGEQGGRYADHGDLHQIYVMRREQADHGRSRHGRSTQSFTNVQTACAPCAARGGFGGEAAAGGTDRLKVL